MSLILPQHREMILRFMGCLVAPGFACAWHCRRDCPAVRFGHTVLADGRRCCAAPGTHGSCRCRGLCGATSVPACAGCR
jgi:hypothetical protein